MLFVYLFVDLHLFLLLQASQKGDPLAALKKQLEEKDKLLSAEQENATASKTRIRELAKVSVLSYTNTPQLTLTTLTTDLPV